MTESVGQKEPPLRKLLLTLFGEEEGGRYYAACVENEVDWDVVKIMEPQHFAELGIPIGPRVRIITAVTALLERQQANKAARQDGKGKGKGKRQGKERQKSTSSTGKGKGKHKTGKPTDGVSSPPPHAHEQARPHTHQAHVHNTHPQQQQPQHNHQQQPQPRFDQQGGSYAGPNYGGYPSRHQPYSNGQPGSGQAARFDYAPPQHFLYPSIPAASLDSLLSVGGGGAGEGGAVAGGVGGGLPSLPLTSYMQAFAPLPGLGPPAPHAHLHHSLGPSLDHKSAGKQHSINGSHPGPNLNQAAPVFLPLAPQSQSSSYAQATFSTGGRGNSFGPSLNTNLFPSSSFSQPFSSTLGDAGAMGLGAAQQYSGFHDTTFGGGGAFTGHPRQPTPLSREPSENLKCPITKDVMEDPVVLADGHTYERVAIEKWLQDNKKSPMTGQMLRSKDGRPNHVVKSLIQEWKEGNKWQNASSS